ncbi:MAG: formate/nitrite transporter family protein [Clostridiales bacterium]|nr:formate/nitrite transporter family protein [Clostridiales bacterium]
MLKTFSGSVCAGILITIGGAIFLSCDNRYIGAVLFAVALLCICYKGYYLFTGKVGYIVESHKKKDWSDLVCGLIGNLITTFLIGMLLRFAIPAMGDAAQTLCEKKLTISLLSVLIRSVFCGVLMYLSVSIFRDHKTPVAILFCIPVFILSGFEHSIADMFYFGASGIFSARIIAFQAMVVLGNSIGGVVLPLLQKAGEGHD